MTSAANPDKAAQALKDYLDAALPDDPRRAVMEKLDNERKAKEVEAMGPLDPRKVRFGSPLENMSTSSMATPRDLLKAQENARKDVTGSLPDLRDLRKPRATQAVETTKLPSPGR